MTSSSTRDVSKAHDADAATTERLATAMHDGVDRVAERARGIEHTLRERGATLGQEARKHEERARIAVADRLQGASHYLRKQPIGLGVALGALAGIVIGGLLLTRR
jgi:ElaB/YqjD/DUF883 family membrane-anchored ribosome-binding protein